MISLTFVVIVLGFILGVLGLLAMFGFCENKTSLIYQAGIMLCLLGIFAFCDYYLTLLIGDIPLSIIIPVLVMIQVGVFLFFDSQWIKSSQSIIAGKMRTAGTALMVSVVVFMVFYLF